MSPPPPAPASECRQCVAAAAPPAWRPSRLVDSPLVAARLRAERVVPRSSDRAEVLERYEAHLLAVCHHYLATLRGVRETFSSTGWAG